MKVADTPDVHLFIGSRPVGADPADFAADHSPRFFMDEAALGIGVRALLRLSLDYLHGG